MKGNLRVIAYGSLLVGAVGTLTCLGEPIMRFGVASDVHIKLQDQELYLEKALRWFDTNKVDAVVFPGDMTHGALVSELEQQERNEHDENNHEQDDEIRTVMYPPDAVSRIVRPDSASVDRVLFRTGVRSGL